MVKHGFDQDALRTFFLPLAQTLRQQPTGAAHPLGAMYAALLPARQAVSDAVAGTPLALPVSQAASPVDNPLQVGEEAGSAAPAKETAAPEEAAAQIEVVANAGANAPKADAPEAITLPLEEDGSVVAGKSAASFVPVDEPSGTMAHRMLWDALSALLEDATYSLEAGLVETTEAAPLSPSKQQLRDMPARVASAVVDDLAHDAPLAMRTAAAQVLRRLATPELERLVAEARLHEALPQSLGDVRHALDRQQPNTERHTQTQTESNMVTHRHIEVPTHRQGRQPGGQAGRRTGTERVWPTAVPAHPGHMSVHLTGAVHPCFWSPDQRK
eukprot:SAG11_NODE_557_length_8549_cov_5.574675_2_plen_328_part_00